MTFQPGANLYTQGFGSRPESVEVPHYDVRAPSSSDILYPIGKRWIWPGNGIYELLQLSSVGGVTSATWVQVANSSGNIESVLGTANQVSVSTSSGTATVSLPSAITTPGSLTTTTTLTATSGNITATNGNLVLGTTGNKLSIATGTNASMGTSVAMTAGTVTISTTAVTASSKIFLTTNTAGGALGTLYAPTASIV